MKILVVGRGWTGYKMLDELNSRGHYVEICSHKKAFTILQEGFDWVVNCAGVTGVPNVDACESNIEETYSGNAIYPALLHNKCTLHRAKFAHFSSGCIYQGEIDHTYKDPNFFGSVYSISKGVSDVYLRDKALVFRIRMPFTGKHEAKNYLSKVLNYAKNGKLIDAGQNSLTDLDEAVKVAADLIEQNAFGPHNLVNSGSIDMHELAEMMELTPQWFTDEEFIAATACKRSTCVLENNGLMRPIRDALAQAIENMKSKAAK